MCCISLAPITAVISCNLGSVSDLIGATLVLAITSVDCWIIAEVSCRSVGKLASVYEDMSTWIRSNVFEEMSIKGHL